MGPERDEEGREIVQVRSTRRKILVGEALRAYVTSVYTVDCSAAWVTPQYTRPLLRSSSMSATASSSTTRTLLAAARPRRVATALRHTRTLRTSPQEHDTGATPQTQEDWLAFQARRAHHKSLGLSA
jgi:hypothetical protein